MAKKPWCLIVQTQCDCDYKLNLNWTVEDIMPCKDMISKNYCTFQLIGMKPSAYFRYKDTTFIPLFLHFHLITCSISQAQTVSVINKCIVNASQRDNNTL